MRPHYLKYKMRLSALMMKSLNFIRPFVIFHAGIIDYIIDLVNYIFCFAGRIPIYRD